MSWWTEIYIQYLDVTRTFLYVDQNENNDHNPEFGCMLCVCLWRQVKLTGTRRTQTWVMYRLEFLLDIEIPELWRKTSREIFTNCLSGHTGILKERRKCKHGWNLLIYSQPPTQVLTDCYYSVVTETHWHHLVMKPENKTKGQNMNISEDERERKRSSMELTIHF